MSERVSVSGHTAQAKQMSSRSLSHVQKRERERLMRHRWLIGALTTIVVLAAIAASAAAHVTTQRQPSATQPAGTCGGEVLSSRPGGGSWVCAFDDEFDASTGDGSALNRSWWTPQVSATSGYITGPYPNYACYLDSPQNISVSGGALHLTARHEARFYCGSYPANYSSGMVTTIGHFSQTYGRFEVRAQLPPTTAAGLQETLWLWPVNDTFYGSWPASGEVDFSEFYSEYSSLDIPVLHYNYDSSTTNTASNTNTATNYCQINNSQYNDYAVVWQPGSFQITINGNLCLTDNYVPDNGLTSPEPFNQPFFIALTQALGIGTNAFNPSTTPLPATTNIDYVRVWK